MPYRTAPLVPPSRSPRARRRGESLWIWAWALTFFYGAIGGSLILLRDAWGWVWIPVAMIFAAIAIGFTRENRRWNEGICARNGTPWRPFGVDAGGNERYIARVSDTEWEHFP